MINKYFNQHKELKEIASKSNSYNDFKRKIKKDKVHRRILVHEGPILKKVFETYRHYPDQNFPDHLEMPHIKYSNDLFESIIAFEMTKQNLSPIIYKNGFYYLSSFLNQNLTGTLSEYRNFHLFVKPKINLEIFKSFSIGTLKTKENHNLIIGRNAEYNAWLSIIEFNTVPFIINNEQELLNYLKTQDEKNNTKKRPGESNRKT